ncbi:hypothetical protein [Candidatus Clostridium stratigraminis]|uniref:DUF4829 domain-containing protein n=1 Tax=Candidatus Clostridium stratigraminis TaxID=3381661 RepID=A0ABW8T883_9CLOT
MKKVQYYYLWLVILMFLMVGCSKSVGITNANTKEVSQVAIDELKIENNQLSKEVDNQKKLLELRNYLDSDFYYLLNDMKKGRIDEIKKKVTSNISVYSDKLVSQLQTGAWNFNFPKDNVKFRQRTFFMKNPQTYEAIYEVWDYKEEKLPECYVEYNLVDNTWKLNSIFIDGGN